MAEPLLILLSGIVVLLAFFMVFAPNPISSAFSLVALMLTLAAIYGAIGAHFVAALQAIVYAGAVMVLFVFSIMLLNMDREKSEVKLKSWRTYLSLGTIALLFLGLASAIVSWSNETRLPQAGPWTLDYAREHGGNALVLSGTLFSQYYLQFEIISLLLLVAMAGALVLAKRKVD